MKSPELSRVRAAHTNQLLAEVIDAYGGLERWNGLKRVEATIVSGGSFFALKGLIQDPDPQQMTVWLHEQRASVLPYGAPDQRTVFTPDRIVIEKVDGTVVAERLRRRTPSPAIRCTRHGTSCTAPTSTARHLDLPDDAVLTGRGRCAGRGDRAVGAGR